MSIEMLANKFETIQNCFTVVLFDGCRSKPGEIEKAEIDKLYSLI